MSKVKLDLSKFSHVKSDKDNATLQHKDGHTLTIAIKALGPESQEQLKAMCHGGKAMMAKGGVSHQSHEEASANSAYDAGLPCKNPHCKSQGQPHPNCRCYGNMAHGGKAESFCDKPRTHFAGCEYLQTGGEAGYTDASYDNVKAHIITNPRNIPVTDARPGFKDRTTPEQDKQRDAANDAANATSRKEHPEKPDNEESYEGYEDYSKGGKVNSDAGNPKLEESKKVPPKSDNTLDYNKLRREFIEIKGRRYYAEGSDDGVVNSVSNWYHDQAKQGTFGTGPQATEQAEQTKNSIQHQRDAGQHTQYARGGRIRYAEGTQPGDTEIPDITQPDAEQSQPQEDNRDIRQLYDKPDMQPDSQEPQADTPPGGYIAPDQQPTEDQQNADTGQEVNSNEAQGAELAKTDPNAITTGEPAPEPGQPLSARQQAIYQVQFAKATQKQHAENMAFAQDIQNGHITPKTYSDLFHNKDTLGKIGMLFGMLVGGAGSGLTHQPNVVMSMMDKQIQNDLEAQKTSKVNGHNFVQLNVQNALNEAQTKLASSHANLTDAQKQEVLANAQKIGYENASIQTYTAAMHNLEEMQKKVPEGNTPDLIQKRQAIQGAMSQLYQKYGDKLIDSNAQIAGASANNEILFGSSGNSPGNSPTNSADSDEQGFQNHQSLLLRQAQSNPAAKQQYDINESKHVYGVPGQASRPVESQDRSKLQAMSVLDNKVKDVIDFANKHRGSVNPNILRQASQKAEELKNFYNGSLDGLGLTKGRLDWLDPQIRNNPTSWWQKLTGNDAALKEIRDSNGNRKNILLKSYGFPVSAPVQSEQQDKPKTTVIPGKTHELKTINGKQYYVPKK